MKLAWVILGVSVLLALLLTLHLATRWLDPLHAILVLAGVVLLALAAVTVSLANGSADDLPGQGGGAGDPLAPPSVPLPLRLTGSGFTPAAQDLPDRPDRQPGP